MHGQIRKAKEEGGKGRGTWRRISRRRMGQSRSFASNTRRGLRATSLCLSVAAPLLCRDHLTNLEPTSCGSYPLRSFPHLALIPKTRWPPPSPAVKGSSFAEGLASLTHVPTDTSANLPGENVRVVSLNLPPDVAIN